MAAYYNEIDAYAAQWLRNLIAQGLIADGFVDERSIEDVYPDDLAGFTQCHFFAGIGIWSLALRRAGWPDSRPAWTGSCPCQPFSSAGQGKGVTDERHIWPSWFWLIEQHRPQRIFGEQVASKAGLGWFDLVSTDLEAARYTVGASDICAAGVGAPHWRQRLWFTAKGMANSSSSRLEKRQADDQRPTPSGLATAGENSKRGCTSSFLVDPSLSKYHERAPGGKQSLRDQHKGSVGRVGNSNSQHSGRNTRASTEAEGRVLCRELGNGTSASGSDDRPGPTNGFWRAADWLRCRDDKWRPVEPGTFPLADGVTNRMGQLRAYGNGISPQAAEAFIRCSL